MSETLLSEIVKAFGLPSRQWVKTILRPVFGQAIRRLAAYGLEYDRKVAQDGGPGRAASELLSHLCHPVESRGIDALPAKGPALLVANHPGTYDALTIFSQLPRPDVRFISSRIPFLQGLPAASRNFIFITIDSHQRMAGIRQALRHLDNGGMVVLFGSGHIDPDPYVYGTESARNGLLDWWPGAEYLVQKTPGLALVLGIVSHVVLPRWAAHPITRLRRGAVNQRRLAELGQLVEQLVLHRRVLLSPRVSFSGPFYRTDLLTAPGSGLMPAIQDKAISLLYTHQAFFP